ncbi:MAG: 2-hydroxyacid dehydrogenase [Candidatus Longimicrobiales bacterium M2_2A_002]
MSRVLVSAEVEAFLRSVEIPSDIEVELLDPDDEVPAGDYTGILPLLTRTIGHDEMDRLEGLRVVANMAVGYDNVDLEAARDRGVRVTNTPDVLTDATAELTWALILAAARRIGEGERLVRAGEWDGWAPTQLLGMGLDGKVLGIVGAGRIGREVGRRAGAFGMDVVYWNRSARDEWAVEVGARRAETVRALAGQADVLSVTVASTPETQHLVGADVLAALRDGAILVNTARGEIVDEAALIRELESGRIRAGLDVYEHEPEVPARLRALENVVLLPHLGSGTRQTRQAMFDLAWENLVRCVRGEAPVTPVV